MAKDNLGALSTGGVTAQVQVVPAAVYNFSFATFSANEGNGTNTTSLVTVTRSVNTTGATSVQLSLASGFSNGATVGTDIIAGPITVSFTNGETSRTVPIEFLGDTTVELNETIALSLANPSDNGNVGTTNPTSTLTITNDDTAIISISNSNIVENGMLAFSVTIDNPVDVAVTADRATQDVTAMTIDSDYTGISSANVTLFAAGFNAPFTVNVSTTGDSKVELDETLKLILSNLAVGGRSVSFSGSGITLEGTGTITNDDTATITIDNVLNANEAGPVAGKFTITQSKVSSTNTAVSYSVQAGSTATAGVDYTTLSGTVTILAGSTTANIDVTAIDDLIVEADETVVVKINSVSGDPQITVDAVNTATVAQWGSTKNLFGSYAPAHVTCSRSNSHEESIDGFH